MGGKRRGPPGRRRFPAKPVPDVRQHLKDLYGQQTKGVVMGDKNRGLYNKFEVRRTDGSSDPGGKHHCCEYFVLDLTHDKHAVAALRAYATSCAAEYPQLAADLRYKLDNDEATAYAWTGGGGVER